LPTSGREWTWTPKGFGVGLLSFIALIVLLRWLGTPEDQKKND
jgi:hypothetical protein